MRAILSGLLLCVLAGCSPHSAPPVVPELSPGAVATTRPLLIHAVRARYTPEALSAGIEGSVTLDAVVLADGTVGDVEVVASLDRKLGLDGQAIEAVRQWRFAPATRAGHAVSVRVPIEIRFSDGLSFVERGQ